jgi:DNA-3-methyladenine glycosylase II
MRLIETIGDLEEGVAALTECEPRFGGVAAHGLPALRRREPGFATLVEIVTEQMISLKAARAIIARLRAACDPFGPMVIRSAGMPVLQGLGLSQSKARAVVALADAAAAGGLDFHALADHSDEDVRRRLTCYSGIGPWTAEIYLLTALGRSDAWPSGDVALQRAAQALFSMEERPSDNIMQALAEKWRPWRSVAARLLWAHYRRTNGILPAVDEEGGPLHRLVAQDIVGLSETKNVPKG